MVLFDDLEWERLVNKVIVVVICLKFKNINYSS